MVAYSKPLAVSVDLSKSNLVIGVQKDFLKEIERIMFDGTGIDHFSAPGVYDQGSFQNYVKGCIEKGTNSVDMKEPVRLESRIKNGSDVRSLIFNYNFQKPNTVYLDIYQMTSSKDPDDKFNYGKAVGISPVALDSKIKDSGLQYPKTPSNFFVIDKTNNHDVFKEREDAHSKKLAEIEERARDRTMALERPTTPAFRKRARILKPSAKKRAKKEAIKIPAYKKIDLDSDEIVLVNVFEELGGPIEYGYGIKKVKWAGKKYKNVFYSLWDKGAIKKQVQGGKDRFVLAE